MATHRIVLVPGFWLGGWAWKEVAPVLQAAGHEVITVTLPGLESLDADRSAITLEDHINAVVDVLESSGDGPSILVGHSGAGSVIYGATDRAPQRVRRAVYVDSGPTLNGMALDPLVPEGDAEIPLPTWDEFEAEGTSLDGLTKQELHMFKIKAVPHPAGPARDELLLTNDARLEVPVTLIASTFAPELIADLAKANDPHFAELNNLDVTMTYVPTGHWPMWSRPHELAHQLMKAAD